MIALKRKFIGMAVAGGLLMGGMSMPASAHILTFDYAATGGFLEGSESNFPLGGSSNTVEYFNADSSACAGPECYGMNWGVPVPSTGDKSGAFLTGASGSVTTDGPLVDFGSLTHFNNPTSESFTGTVQIGWHLDLLSGGVSAKVVDLVFELAFTETVNTADPVASRDEFTYSLVSGPLNEVFTFDGDTYQISLAGFFDDAGNLTTTFFSPEGGDNTGLVKFTVDHVAVPAPGVIALMGIGMLGMVSGVARRRKQ